MYDHTHKMASAQLTPREQERNEFGYEIEQIRDRHLRIIKRTSKSNTTDTCVFFVHGGGGRACQFKHQILALQDMIDIVAIDFLGHGDSPAPNNPLLYTADEHLLDLMEIVLKYRKSRNFIVAHCYGALHTFRLLKHLNNKDMLDIITGVVTVAIGNRCPLASSWFGYVPATILEWLRPLARTSSNAAIFTPQTDPNLITFENSISDNNKMYVMKVLGIDCSNSANWTTWLSEAREIIINKKIPITIIAGEGDGVYPPDTCQELAKSFELPDQSFHVVQGVGHLVMLEKPVILTGIVKEFIGAN